MSLRCPVCCLPLLLQSKTYVCNNNHSFDMAKHGYVNLLMVHQKRSKDPGDNQEMIKSRDQFLNKGYYDLLSDKLNQIVLQNIPLQNPRILDIGCGTGYYLSRLKESLTPTSHLYGIDISKPAIQTAAKRKTNATLAVASAYNLPFLDDTFDLIYAVFSPISPQECARVLKKNGILVMVGPQEEHLSGLTKYIYEQHNVHKGNSVLDETDIFKHIQTIKLKENITVAQEDILDLIKMTPYYWQMSQGQLEKITTIETLKTPIDFSIKVYCL